MAARMSRLCKRNPKLSNSGREAHVVDGSIFLTDSHQIGMMHSA
jgi:hypothetical protein